MRARSVFNSVLLDGYFVDRHGDVRCGRIVAQLAQEGLTDDSR